MNDFVGNVTGEMDGYAKPYFEIVDDALVPRNIPVPLKSKKAFNSSPDDSRRDNYTVLNRSHLFNLTRYAMKVTIGGRKHWTRKGKFAPDPVMVNTSSRMIREIHRLCQDKGLKFHTVLLHTNKTQSDWKDLIYLLKSELDEVGIEASVFRSKSFPTTDHWRNGHLNRYGNELLARHIRAILDS